jgi:hypothetical protein
MGTADAFRRRGRGQNEGAQFGRLTPVHSYRTHVWMLLPAKGLLGCHLLGNLSYRPKLLLLRQGARRLHIHQTTQRPSGRVGRASMIGNLCVDCGNDETAMNESRTTGRPEKGI